MYQSLIKSGCKLSVMCARAHTYTHTHTLSPHLTPLMGSATLRKTRYNETNFTISFLTIRIGWLLKIRVKFLQHLISVVIKWHWIKWCYFRPCCILKLSANLSLFSHKISMLNIFTKLSVFLNVCVITRNGYMNIIFKNRPFLATSSLMVFYIQNCLNAYIFFLCL